ncbi:hypothetical protein [Sphaerimonospora thailandensis]|nr:hypothetical protein [Sphaerimonospora thailandensis]
MSEQEKSPLESSDAWWSISEHEREEWRQYASEVGYHHFVECNLDADDDVLHHLFPNVDITRPGEGI